MTIYFPYFMLYNEDQSTDFSCNSLPEHYHYLKLYANNAFIL